MCPNHAGGDNAWTTSTQRLSNPFVATARQHQGTPRSCAQQHLFTTLELMVVCGHKFVSMSAALSRVRTVCGSNDEHPASLLQPHAFGVYMIHCPTRARSQVLSLRWARQTVDFFFSKKNIHTRIDSLNRVVAVDLDNAWLSFTTPLHQLSTTLSQSCSLRFVGL